MAEQKFPDGAVVQLKSGGPSMTVISFAEHYGEWKYTCQWFDDKKVLQHSTFTEAVLTRVD